MKVLDSIVLSSLVLAAAGTVAMADVGFTPSGSTSGAGTGNDGIFFTVGASNIWVTHLGEFNGTDMSHTVGIFNVVGGNASGPSLIQTSVTTNSSGNGWSYTDVSGSYVELQANTQYVLVGFNAGGFQFTANYGNAGIGAGIASFDFYAYNETGSFDPIMTVSPYSPAYFGPNFQYTVPTPGAAALIGVGGLVSLRRRRTA